jgi:hypothetical protein
MTERISKIDVDGSSVYAAFLNVTLPDGRAISQHQGTFRTEGEAAERIAKVKSGWKPSFYEDEPE